MKTLRREPTPVNEAIQNGIDFENLVTGILNGHSDPTNRWNDAAARIAYRIKGGILQDKAMKRVTVNGMDSLMYGRLDALKAGEIIGIKFSRRYDRGKYISSTQHPFYLELVSEASRFTYLPSNGTEVWSETYRREETPSIFPIISDFADWLHVTGNMSIYWEKWQSKT